jgi:dTDP-4-dehydrorhamnose 3,5-epimerase
MIDGVIVEPLKLMADERGRVMHMLRADSPFFTGFGEIYFSTVNPGAVKAWRRHRRMTLRYAVPVGNVKVVIYDDRQASLTKGQVQEVRMGEDNYCLLIIPPLVWSGFQGISSYPALVANCADMPHNPEEADRLDPYDRRIPYDWGSATPAKK